MFTWIKRLLGYLILPLLIAGWQLFFYPFLPPYLALSFDAVFCVGAAFILPIGWGVGLMLWFGFLMDACQFPFVSIAFLTYPLLFLFLHWLIERFFATRSHLSFLALTVLARCLLVATVWATARLAPSLLFFLGTLMFDILLSSCFSILYQRFHQVVMISSPTFPRLYE